MERALLLVYSVKKRPYLPNAALWKRGDLRAMIGTEATRRPSTEDRAGPDNTAGSSRVWPTFAQWVLP